MFDLFVLSDGLYSRQVKFILESACFNALKIVSCFAAHSSTVLKVSYTA
jgi:hypothetical protein